MDNKVQKKLHDLFVAYGKNLPDKIHNIESLWQEQQQHWDLVQFQDFHREVHSLCGSSGTYGYIELSKVARQMEVFLKAILSKGRLDKTDKEKIASYMNQLKSVLTLELPKKMTFIETEAPENKSVYILESDEFLVKQLSYSLKQLSYSSHIIQDLNILKMAVNEKPPIAIIIDTEFLEDIGIQLILDLQKDQTIPIQLFCILPNDDLLPRLAAVRAGCNAFFQKPVDVSYLTQVLNHKCSIIPDEPYRILIIDDSESLAKYYTLILNQAGMTARAITEPLELLKELESFQPNLLLMDIYMPECTGFELAAILRQEKKYTKIPIIFLSTEEDKEKKLFAISLGGDDFLTKPVSPQHLVSAVKSRSKRAGILNYYMTTDSLTGLLNHSSILQQLDVHLARTDLTKNIGSFVMIDIDHFKKINDTYGHPIGDMVIKKLSTFFLSRLRGQDSVGRYGGEEFVLILPGASLEDSKKICNDLRLQFSKYCFRANNNDFFVTFSAGISCFDGSIDAPRIIEQADQSLYKAKQMGRNQIIVFEK